MTFNRNIHHRCSIRLPGYDYSQPNAYFVTICAFRKECLFGEVSEAGEMRRNEVGRMVQSVWDEVPSHFLSVGLDEFVIMPNHVHGIIWINDDSIGRTETNIVRAQFIAPRTGTMPRSSTNMIGDARNRTETVERWATYWSEGVMSEGVMNHAPTVGDIVRAFKAKVTFLLHRNGFPYFAWHRNYYERIIRSDRELYMIRRYISENPTKWAFDPENPMNKPKKPCYSFDGIAVKEG